MSWILGFVGHRVTSERRHALAATHESELFRSVGETYYVAVGGLVKTCHFGALPGQIAGHWCVVGTGIRTEFDRCHLLTSGDWRRRMRSRPQTASLGGGFVGLQWSPRGLEAFTDGLGLRTCYWTPLRDGHAFSTRLDWLAALRGGSRISPAALGSHWLTHHQLSYRCLVEGVDRLPPGGRLFLTGDAVRTETTRPESEEAVGDDVSRLLASYLCTDTDQAVSLGLSGGMDSRVLLALRPRRGRFSVHSFGPPERPDVAVAGRIAERLDVPMSHFNLPLPDVDEIVELFRRRAVQSNAISPASAAASLRYYGLLHAQGKLVVDGGFGEIVRRRYMNRLVVGGRKALESGNVPAAFEHVRHDRADVFSREYEKELGFSARRDLQALVDDLPPATRIGVENVADRIGVRTRLPNFFGFEQARLDAEVQSYMPYAQPDVLRTALRLSVPVREMLSRRLIARYEPALRSFPLVKGHTAYPYRLPETVGKILLGLRRRFASRFPTEGCIVFRTIREYTLDRLHSAEVRSSDMYDGAKLDALAEAFYRDGSRASEVDWWLALDFWREAMERGRSA